MKLFGLNKTLKEWLTLLAITMAGGSIFKISFMRDVFYIPMGEAFGVNHTQLGWMMTAFALTQFVSYLPGGWLTDIVSVKILIPVSLILSGLCGLWLSTFPSFPIVLLIQAVQGVTITLLFWQAMIKGTRLLGSKEEQGRLFGLLEGGRGFFSTIISFAALWVFDQYVDSQLGLKATMIFYGVVFIVLGFACYFLIEEDEVEGQLDAKGALKGLAEVAKVPEVWLAGAIIFFGYSFYNGLGYLTPYLTEIQKVPVNVGAAIAIIRTYLIAFLAAPIGGILADKLGSTIKFLVYALLIGAGLTAAFILFPQGTTLIMIIAVMLILASIVMMIRGTYYATSDEIKIPLYLAGSAAGVLSLVGNTPDLFIFTLYGNILDKYPGITGYKVVFGVMIGFAILGAISAFVLYRKVKAKNALVTAEGEVINE